MVASRLHRKKQFSKAHNCSLGNEKKLKALLVAAVEHTSDAIEIVDAQAQIRYVNPAFETVTGYSQIEAIGQKTTELLHTDLAGEPFEQSFWQTNSHRQTWRGIVNGMRKDGSPFSQEVTISPIFNTHRQADHYVTVRRDITQRQQVEVALRESEERFRTIVETMPVPILISRLTDGTILYANPQVELAFGLSTQALVGCKSTDFYADPVVRQTLLQKLAQDGSLRNYEVQAKRSDGTLFWVAVSMQTLTFEGEVAIFATFYDITSRKQAETSLNQRARQQAAIAALGQRALVGLDLNLLLHEAVELIAQTLNVEFAGVFELLPNGQSLILKAGVGWQPELVGTALVGTQSYSQLGYTLLTQQPTLVKDLRLNTQFSGPPLLHNHHIVSGISVVIPGQEQPFGVLGAYTSRLHPFSQDDIYFLETVANVLATAIQRRQAETRLHLMERVIAASSNGIVITDASLPDNPLIYVNPAFESMTGYTADEIIGQNCRFLQQSDRDQPGLTTLRTAIQFQQECHVVLRNYRKDGTLFWNELRIAPVFDAEGYLTHFVGVQTDISKRIHSETALREQEEQYRRIVETATEGIWVLDQDGNTTFVNQQMSRMLGYETAQLINQPLFSFMDKADVITANAYLERRQQGIWETHDFKFRRKDGTELWAIVSTAFLSDAHGNHTGILVMLTDVTDRKRTEAALLTSEQRLESILQSIEDMVWSVSAASKQIIYLNPATEKIYNRSVSEFFANSNLWLEVVHPEDQERVRLNAEELLKSGSKAIEYRIIRPNGEVRWVYDRGWATYDADGTATRLDGISTDITERKQVEEALRDSEERFRLSFELAPIGMAVTTPEGKYLAVNQAICEALGYTADEMMQLSFSKITHADDLAASLAFNQKLLRGEISHFQMEKRYLAKDGRAVYTILQASLIRNALGQPLHIIAQMVDITARKQMEEKLIYDACHDALTGLPNRHRFTKQLKQAIARAKQSPEAMFAVLFLDLDRFKVVNDSLGHLVGDQLLVAIAQSLQSCVSAQDTVARLGGDEFTILLTSVHTVEDVIAVAELIQRVLQPSFRLGSYEVFINTSIGIALSTIEYSEPEDVLRDADTALYHAKERGRAQYAIFDAEMYNQVVALLQLETDLRWAIERQELQVYYQPIVSLTTGSLTGFEALVRWHHPQRGMVPPSEFIAIAEETGLIILLGQWVLHQACAQLHQWQQQFPWHSTLTVSVNLSAKQFSQPCLIEQITQTLDETGLAPKCLKLEITESGIMQNARLSAKLLSRLKALQVQLYVDDFGTGYSSLSRLHEFAIDALKIDRSFIETMHQQSKNAEIVQAIINLAHNLGMDVVAEGIETPEQLMQLKQLNCGYGQGYLFAKPLNQAAAQQLLMHDYNFEVN